MVSNAATRKSNYEVRKAKGLCASPGCKGLLEHGSTYCQKHKDYYREYSKNKSKERRESGLCRQCGTPVVSGKSMCPDHLKLVVDAIRLKTQRDPQQYFLNQAKARSKKFNLPFDLEKEDIVVPEFCPVLRIPLTLLSAGKLQDNTPSIDRVFPEKGYVKGNVRVISWRANKLKCDGSLEDFENIVRYMKESV